MRKESQGILTTTPDVTLAAIIPKLNKVTGKRGHSAGPKACPIWMASRVWASCRRAAADGADFMRPWFVGSGICAWRKAGELLAFCLFLCLAIRYARGLGEAPRAVLLPPLLHLSQPARVHPLQACPFWTRRARW